MLVRDMNSYFLTNILLTVKIKVANACSRIRYALSSSIDIVPVYPHSPSGPCSPGGPLGPWGPTSPENKRVVIEWLGFCSFFTRLWPTWIFQIQNTARAKIQWKQYRGLLNIPRRTKNIPFFNKVYCYLMHLCTKTFSKSFLCPIWMNHFSFFGLVETITNRWITFSTGINPCWNGGKSMGSQQSLLFSRAFKNRARAPNAVSPE